VHKLGNANTFRNIQRIVGINKLEAGIEGIGSKEGTNQGLKF